MSVNRKHAERRPEGVSERAALIFGLSTAVFSGLVLLFSAAMALTDHPFRAVLGLGVGVATLGILRAGWPGRPWYASRSKWLDVSAFVAVGLAIVLLAPLVALGAT